MLILKCAADAFWRTMIGDRDGRGGCPAPPEFQTHFAVHVIKSFANAGWTMSKEEGENLVADPNFQHIIKSGDQLLFKSRWFSKIQDHRFVITEKGRLGLAPMDTKRGDQVAIFGGGSPVYIIRGSSGIHQLIGDGYVHGLMHGEALMEKENRFEEFVLR